MGVFDEAVKLISRVPLAVVGDIPMYRSALITLSFLMCGVSLAWGQSPRYQPPGGNPIPSGLNYFRKDTGVLDPYNTFVEPQRQIQRRFDSMSALQRLQFNETSRDIREIRQSSAAETGSNATFFNSSHYYPALRGRIGGAGGR
jgi:hypothetical protein